MLFSHATSCYQVTPLQAIFPISRSFRWKQNVFFSPATNNFFQSLWYDSGGKKRDFDVWNRWIFPHRSTPSGRWRTLLALRAAISAGFCFIFPCSRFILRGLISQIAMLVGVDIVTLLEEASQTKVHATFCYHKMNCEVVKGWKV